MKNNTAILIKTTICIFLIMSLSGCWNRRELDTLSIVMGVGVDKTEEPGKVQVTVQMAKPGEIKSQKDSRGGVDSSNAFWNIQNTGDTIFNVLRDLTNKSSRKLFYPHNQVLIFGRSIAEEGVRKHIDFFLRDPETRINVFFLVSQGKAGDILDVKSELEKIPANNIAKLVENQALATSQTLPVKLKDFAARLMSKTTAPIAPFIDILGEGDKQTVIISGTAVFKDDKLVGRMDKSEGRGILWVLGEVKSGIIELDGPGNEKTGLEIIRAGSKILPEIKDNKIYMRIEIHEEGNIGEQTGTEDLSKPDAVKLLEKIKSDKIRSEIMLAVKKAQELNADVFGFGDAVHKKYPKQWKELESKWDELFPHIVVEVEVEAKLRLMGRISKPTLPEQEKK